MGQQRDLILEIYAAAVDQSRWHGVLSQIVRAGPAVAASILIYDKTEASAPVGVNAGYPNEMIADYLGYYYLKNPVSALVSSAEVGKIIGPNEMSAEGDFQHTEFFNDFLLKWGMGAGVQICVGRGQT